MYYLLSGRHINCGAAASVVGTWLQTAASTALRNALEKRKDMGSVRSNRRRLWALQQGDERSSESGEKY